MRPTASKLEVFSIDGLPDVKLGDDVSALIADATEKAELKLHDGDILVVTQKIVSKAEGKIYKLDDIKASPFADQIAKSLGKDPRHVEVILRESKRIVKMDKGILICETKHGFVCANAAVDHSNLPEGYVASLPDDPDKSAKKIRDGLRKRLNVDVPVIISDTFGRPWREGHLDVAVGVAGLKPIRDYRGSRDTFGNLLQITTVAVADELASASELVKGKADNVPIAVVRGYKYEKGSGSARELVRNPSLDLFR